MKNDAIDLLKYYIYASGDEDLKHLLVLWDFLDYRYAQTVDAFIVTNLLGSGVEGFACALQDGSVGFYIDDMSALVSDILPRDKDAYKNARMSFMKHIRLLIKDMELPDYLRNMGVLSHGEINDIFSPDKTKLALFGVIDSLFEVSSYDASVYSEFASRRPDDILYFLYDEYTGINTLRLSELRRSILNGTGDEFLDNYLESIKKVRTDGYIRYIDLLNSKYEKYGKKMLDRLGITNRDL